MGYVMAGGLRTYYAQWGTSGEPVLLLHGGGVTADSWWGQGPALGEHYRVYAPERRGHGRTPDPEGPYGYPLMADDTAAFAEAVGTGPAAVIGWSDGATVAAHLALRRPDLVSRLVLIGTAITPEGTTESGRRLVCGDAGSREVLAGWFRPQYEPLSPDGPEHFPVVFEKLLAMWAAGSGLELGDLAGITAPTLVMQGDRDEVRVSHSAQLAETVPGGQLAVVPDTTHGLPLEKPELVTRLLADFLGGARPRRLTSMSVPGPDLAPAR